MFNSRGARPTGFPIPILIPYGWVMTLWFRHKHSVASGFLIVGLALGTGHSGAQVVSPAPDAETGSPPQQEQPQELSSDPEAVRAAHLNELFSELAKPDNPDWRTVQAQIWAAWNHSGSPSMDLLLQRASDAMDQRDTETALLHLNDLVRLAPDYAEGWNKRATVYFLQGDYGASVADIQRVLMLEPRHFGALSGLGIILDRLGDEEGAMRAYRKTLEIHPHLEPAQEAVERLSPEVDGREL